MSRKALPFPTFLFCRFPGWGIGAFSRLEEARQGTAREAGSTPAADTSCRRPWWGRGSTSLVSNRVELFPKGTTPPNVRISRFDPGCWHYLATCPCGNKPRSEVVRHPSSGEMPRRLAPGVKRAKFLEVRHGERKASI